MPFTFAHPAIVLPFGLIKKNWFSMTGLIVGSMSPDFEYFFRMHIRSDFSHTIPGLFFFDLPATLLIALIFHQLIKEALILNLPAFLSARFQKFANENWFRHLRQNFLIVLISILIGVVSHILWDSFTHADGYFVTHITSLQKNVFAEISVYKILQHGSTVLGLLTLMLVIFSLPKSKTVRQMRTNKLVYWLIIFTVATVAISVYLAAQNDFPTIGNLIVASISSGFIGLIISSLWYKIYNF